MTAATAEHLVNICTLVLCLRLSRDCRAFSCSVSKRNSLGFSVNACTLLVVLPRIVVFGDTGHTAGFCCGGCGALWAQSDKAALCCSPPPCASCQTPVLTGDALCGGCGERALREQAATALQTAAKILYVEYEAPYLYWSDTDRFFRTKTAIDDYCVSRNLVPPRWVWGVEPKPLELSATDVLTASTPDLAGLIDEGEIAELQTGLDAWAMKLPIKNFKPDYTTVVVLDPSLYEEFAKQR